MDHGDPRRAVERLKYTVTVTDLPGVQRILTTLVGRRHAISHFEAEEAAGHGWRVTVDCPSVGQDPALLLERLSRFPSVLAVTCARGSQLDPVDVAEPRRRGWAQTGAPSVVSGAGRGAG